MAAAIFVVAAMRLLFRRGHGRSDRRPGSPLARRHWNE